ncbi:MAG TPA: LD-carboxypeptidase [Myxococcales bacterium]|nr:LD-carboxypeptidase [Deltaproteobacteria bacterium]MBU47653.1 LD-carboxypeptidase [Deltaproteobacteria bacterium]HAA58260.1 LD-carboxypeptidase [Myxococcales bacterium]
MLRCGRDRTATKEKLMDQPSLPPPCKSGDRVAIIAPAGPFQEKWLFEGCERLRSWGLEPIYEKELFSTWGYLAGSDAHRLESLHKAFRDDNVKAILCARGGYGTFRLLDGLDLPLLQQHAKRFLGFSDITMLHQVFAQQCGFIGFHSPMAASQHFIEGSPTSVERVKQALFADDLATIFSPIQGDVLQQGPRATGRLVGGNLSLLAASVGTPWQVDTQDAILFVEEVAEPPYRIDRMWQQLRYAGLLKPLRGIVFGDFGPLRDRYTTYTEEEFWLNRIGMPEGIPVLHKMPFGHIRDNATLPVGASVTIDAETATLHAA